MQTDLPAHAYLPTPAPAPAEAVPRARATAGAARDIAVDNIRTLALVWVVIGHAVCGYSHVTQWWWFIPEANPSAIADIVMVILPLGLLVPLFFLAGYMVGPSLDRRGFRRYWTERLKRLGVPWLFCTVMVSPLLMYIWSRHHDQAHDGYLAYLKQFFAGYKHPYVGLIDELNAVDRHYLWWHQLWFAPTILLLTSIAHGVSRLVGWSRPQAIAGQTSAKILLGWTAASTVAVCAMSVFLPDYKPNAFIISNVLAIFQPRHLLYLGVFLAGFHLERRGFKIAELPGANSKWTYALLLPAYALFTAGLAGIIKGDVTPASAAHWFETLGIIATSWVLILATARLSRDLAQPIGWLAKLAPGSMHMYFNHYVICVGANLAVAALSVPTAVKLLLSCVISLPLSVAGALRPRVAALCFCALQLALLLGDIL